MNRVAAPPVTLLVNGETHALSLPPATRLSEALREGLGLTGTKVGCDAGDCGACTVLLEGAQACACLVPLGQCEGARIETVEGIAATPEGQALAERFHAAGAAQCGICTPGMLVAATELLRENPTPSEAEVEEALGGVLCRCTGYRRIVEAVLGTGPAAEEGGVGARLPRTDGAPKLDGTALYGADGAPADALWLRTIRSPHPHARVILGDLEGFARAHPGLRLLTARDVPGRNGYGIYPHIKDQPVLAGERVLYRGDAVAALVGPRDPVLSVPPSALPIAFEVLPALGDPDVALGANAMHTDFPDNVLAEGRVTRGDPVAALAEAAHVVEGTWRTSFVEHAYLEPEAGWARRVGDRVEIWCSTQAPAMDREEVAGVLGLSLEAVRIIPSACGGGFGGKLDAGMQPLLALAAWVTGRPVRAAWTRPESMAASTKRHPARITARAGCDAEGRLLALEFEGIYDTGAYASWGPTVAGRVPVHATGPYRVPHVSARARAVFTHQPPSGAFRGFGVPQAAIAQEALWDRLADACGLDRLEFRIRNALVVGDETATGQVLAHSAGQRPCLEALRPRWNELRAEAAARNAKGGTLRHGVGIAGMWYGIGNTGMSNPSEMRLILEADGTLTFLNGAVDIGQGSSTVLCQIAAEALGVPVSALRHVNGDTDLTPDAGKTSASRQTFVSGRAAMEAALDLRARVLAGRNAAIGWDGKRLTVGGEAFVPAAALEGVGRFDPPTTPLDGEGQGVPYATYGFAAQICALAVDTRLGTVALQRFVAAHDVGRAVNPTLVEGQTHGGIAQGIGLALMEEYIPGRTENLHDYLIPSFGDVPPIECLLVEESEPLGPFGAKGVGEPALVATAPAIFSAIRDATGVEVTRIPALPHRLRAALKEAGW
ncbi:molybdopterin-dependent oxidoreductase [Sabulicella glaciei]|uniref:Molybdopterin-dependent oxidoreductase n=1 Tax=Sabulicella glaciei TaxID=2984948 RepID=A0ABT3NQN5_9PROT|nr:molybdopterin cofactor-binding domain-containing protein [Roseococcus sp. MDT2-1-1]MCW8084461.1 molybdopterin-dependent oxidoreductase [Roseococcus sp. MDT2-1-1]